MAQADIGLVKGGKGTAYVTILGGYQHRDGGAAIAPAAPNEVNPLPGVDVDALAIVTPDKASATVKVRDGDRSAEAEAHATPDDAESKARASQSSGSLSSKIKSMAKSAGDQQRAGTSTQNSNGSEQITTSADAEQTGDSFIMRGAVDTANAAVQVGSSGNARATINGSSSAGTQSAAQGPFDSAGANASSNATVGDPSITGASGNVRANSLPFTIGGATFGNPTNFSLGPLNPSAGDASALAAASSTANNAPVQSSANANTAASIAGSGSTLASSMADADASSARAVTGGSVNVTGASANFNADVNADLSGALIRASSGSGVTGIDSGSQSRARNSGGAKQAVSSASNQIGSGFAAGSAQADSTPDQLNANASVTYEISPAAGIDVSAEFDRRAHAPAVAFDSSSGPIMTDLMNQNLEAEDGAFGGGTLGYVFMNPLLGLVDRAEAYMTRARNQDDERQHSFTFQGVSADGQAIVAGFSAAGYDVETREELDQTELGLRFKSDRMAQGTVPLIVSLEPFYMRYEQKARYGARNLVEFFGSVEADLWGSQLALESEIPVFGEALSWVGRVAGGIYYMDADGKFSNTFTSDTLAPGQSETGYRLGAETGLRMVLTPHASITATGAVDHLSEAPFVAFRDRYSGEASYVGADELTQYRANLRLTLTTQLHRAQPVAYK